MGSKYLGVDAFGFHWGGKEQACCQANSSNTPQEAFTLPAHTSNQQAVVSNAITVACLDFYTLRHHS